MKQTIKNYSFSASSKTVTFSDFSSIVLERVYLITNVTSNTLIYQFNNNALGGTASTNVLTLTYNTGSMSNTDKLQIIYDATVGDPDYDNLVNINIDAIAGGVTIPVSGTVTTSPSGTQTVSGTIAATESGTWNVGSSSATGSSPPNNAFYIAGKSNGGNLTGIGVDSGGYLILSGGTITSGDSLAWNAPSQVLTLNSAYNGSTWDRVRSITGATSTGTGVLAAGAMGQYLSSSPSLSNGNFEPLQVDSSGNLKVNIANNSSASVQYADNAVQSTPTGNVALGYDGTNVRAVKTDSSGDVFVVGSIASGSADSGNPVKVGGIYHASTPSFSDGQRGDLQLDSSGNAKTYLATKLDNVNDSITVYPFGHSYQNITSNATTTVKASAGVLVGITVGGIGSSWQAIFYDNTAGSGTVILTLTISSVGFISMGPLAFVTGLTIVTSGTTAGNFTVFWR